MINNDNISLNVTLPIIAIAGIGVIFGIKYRKLCSKNNNNKQKIKNLEQSITLAQTQYHLQEQKINDFQNVTQNQINLQTISIISILNTIQQNNFLLELKIRDIQNSIQANNKESQEKYQSLYTQFQEYRKQIELQVGIVHLRAVTTGVEVINTQAELFDNEDNLTPLLIKYNYLINLKEEALAFNLDSIKTINEELITLENVLLEYNNFPKAPDSLTIEYIEKKEESSEEEQITIIDEAKGFLLGESWLDLD